MKIGIISDTHNNVENLHKALNRLRQEDVVTIFHCGDLTDPATARLLDGFQVYFTYGNGDTASWENPRNTALIQSDQLGRVHF